MTVSPFQTKNQPTWKSTAACPNDIRDVYIMEHRNCGAYTHFPGPDFDYPDSFKSHVAEEEEHPQSLRDAIVQHCDDRRDSDGDPEHWNIHVRCFLKDLRGSVRMLITEGENYDF